jgi:preprotein translocase subunit YajC
MPPQLPPLPQEKTMMPYLVNHRRGMIFVVVPVFVIIHQQQQQQQQHL